MLLAEIPLIAGCVLIIFILGMAFSRLFTQQESKCLRKIWIR